MRSYAILSPTMGMREDFPSILLPDAYTEKNKNTVIRHGEIHRAQGRITVLLDDEQDPVQTPDENPILRYHRLVKRGTGDEHLYVFTKDHIYEWDSGNKQLTQRWECSSSCDNWDTVSYGDRVIATNYVDKILAADGSGNFEPLDSEHGLEYTEGFYVTRARYLAVFENYLIVAHVEEGATLRPQRIRWSALGNENEWKSGDSGAAEVGHDDIITGLRPHQGFLFIFKERSYYKMWLVPSVEVFNMAAASTRVGCFAKDSIINDAHGELWFFGSDNAIRSVRGEIISRAIDKTMKNVNSSLTPLIKSHYNRRKNELWWSIPHGSDSEKNNMLVVFSEEKWSKFDMAVSCFGNFANTINYTWDLLSYASWDDWGWESWMDVQANPGFLIELAGGYDGYTYGLNSAELDKGQEFVGSAIISTDLAERGAMNMFKRVLNLKIYARREGGGILKIDVKRDSSASWQTVGQIDLESIDREEFIIKDLPCDIRARTFHFRVSAENAFRFVGMIIDYIPAGTR